jgi:hypothetical protein
MDFIEGLPRSANMDTILVVVDTFSKYVHFLPLLHPFTTFKVAHVFLNLVYKLHGMLVSIILARHYFYESILARILQTILHTIEDDFLIPPSDR